MKNKFWTFLRQTYIFLIIALIYIPLIVVVLLSFTQPGPKGNISIGYNAFDWNGGKNFLDLFHNQVFLNALANTAIIVAFVVPISVIIAIITCFGIWNAKQVYQSGILGASKVNVVVPDIITAISLALLFSVTWIAWFKANLGFVTIILAHISFCVPYAILMIYPRMQKMNKNLILVSQDLGYSKIKTFFKVTLPFLTPSVFTAAAVVFGMSFDDFIITSLVGGKVNTISTEMYTMSKGIQAWAITFGALLILLTFLIVIIMILKKGIQSRKTTKIKNAKRYSYWIKT